MRFVRSSIVCLVLCGAVAACSSKEQGTEGSSAQSLTSVNVYHSNQNGGGVNGAVNHYDSQGYFNMWFNAWENKTGNSRSAALSFQGFGASFQQVCFNEQICSAWDYNTWSCTAWETVQYCYNGYTNPYYVYGYGDIQNGDFRIGGHTAHLTTDLANDPTFFAIRCSFDSNWFYTCTPITSGTIDVTWRDNGQMSKDVQGTWSSTATSPWGGQYSTHSTGHMSEISADASGTFLGNDVNASGTITQSRDTMITKDVFKSPQPPAPGDGGAPPPPPPPDGG